MAGSYAFLEVEDEFFGIVYTFNTPKYGYTGYFNTSVYQDLLVGYEALGSNSYSFGFFNKDLNPESKNGGDEDIGIRLSTL